MLNQPDTSETISVLAIEIGSVHTRSMLFSEVDGQYHFIADGIAPTSTFKPLNDFNAGLFQSVQSLQSSTGVTLLDEESHLIIPSQSDGAGVDRLVITFSAGTEVRVVTMGLLQEFSLRAASDLARTSNTRVVEQLSSNDQRTVEKQMSAVVNSRPELFIFAGGTEGGATQSLERLIDLLADIYKVLPQECNPRIIYAGNKELADKVQKVLGQLADIQIAPNLKPALDTEQLLPARETLARTVTEIEDSHLEGLHDLSSVASSPIMPSSYRFGQMVQFLGKLYDPVKGVLGVNLGATWTSISAANSSQSVLKVLPIGLGKGLDDVLRQYPLAEIHRWLKINLSLEDLENYLHQKILFPGSLPLSPAAMEIEQAAAREILRRASHELLQNWQVEFASFEPIVAGGSFYSNTSSPAASLLTILDGIQPIGVTTVILDTHNLLSSLGAAASLSSFLPVQVLESSAFTNLGAVINPVAFERPGTPILRVTVEYEDGNTSRTDIRQGTITALPVSNGQPVNIHMEPLRQVLIDPFKNVRGFRMLGGLCGVVVDARGRPLELPKDDAQRKELLTKWSGFMAA